MSDDELAAMAGEELDAASALPLADIRRAHEPAGAVPVEVEVEVRDLPGGGRAGAEARAILAP